MKSSTSPSLSNLTPFLRVCSLLLLAPLALLGQQEEDLDRRDMTGQVLKAFAPNQVSQVGR